MEGQHPLDGQGDAWERVIEDTEATAAEYGEAGWETIQLHPGDVTALPGIEDPATDRVGLDVLVPGDEYEAVADAVSGADFDEYEVYRAEGDGVVFGLVAMQAPADRRVILVPVYYEPERATRMLREVRAADELNVYVRPLSDDERVVFTIDDPEPLLSSRD